MIFFLQKYLAMATKNNAFQLLAQYQKWHELSERKLIGWFKSKKELQYKNELEKLEVDIKTLLHQEKFEETVSFGSHFGLRLEILGNICQSTQGRNHGVADHYQIFE
jgi:hypothetical protein